MAFLEQRLNVKLAQKQILTPGLVQMVSVLALNKLELSEMISQELMETLFSRRKSQNLPQPPLKKLTAKRNVSENQRTRKSSMLARKQSANKMIPGQMEFTIF